MAKTLGLGNQILRSTLVRPESSLDSDVATKISKK